MSIADKYTFRDAIVRRLADDLVGPGDGPEELIDEAPLDRYIVGILWPADGAVQEDVATEPGSAPAGDDDGTEDTPVAQSLMRYPSSMGLTFTVDSTLADAVSIVPTAASYTPVDDQGATPAQQPQPQPRSRSRRRSDRSWRRSSAAVDPVTVDLTTPGATRHRLVDGLTLYVLVRPPSHDEVTVTAVLINVRRPSKGTPRDAQAWFQVGLSGSTSVPAFVDRSRSTAPGDDDLDSAALLYRDNHSFAAGHGCAAAWGAETGRRVADVRTALLPQHDVSRARPRQIDDVDLRMSRLQDASHAELTATLGRLMIAYRSWIDDLERQAAGPELVEDSLRRVAATHIDRARQAADRIEAGVALLTTDPDALDAFRLMNRAMQTQRARQDWIRSGAHGAPPDGTEQRWYPFQLAFILLTLPGLSDREHPDRDLADVLWFPTGGGKTEAYLGLIAYLVLLRRLRNPSAAGVAVIMRYTLRLLTIQQFERASMLMCSLEHLRRQDATRLGEESFSIGLWVGAAATPQTLTDARKALNKLRAGHDVEEGSPRQLLRCPWCGADLTVDHYRVTTGSDERLLIACGREGCNFRDGLPVFLVDEDVYRHRPELLIGTVDKFARITWKSEVRGLFGRDGVGDRPDLVIQDELHLISGPLGSMVGLYETAVDAACAVDPTDPLNDVRRRPKVIASTATIRRAADQVRAVFDRRAVQFPPPGLDPDRSFFAEPADSAQLGNRRYLGLMAPGTSHQTLMIRVYASLLQSAADIDGAEHVRDPYWTLLGYFNSLRVLGSAMLQVQDDVKKRLAFLAGRTGTTRRAIDQSSELTSRVNARQIPESLNRLETSLPATDAYDVVLATNMISVGVDVDRLGLMAVMGQPQSTAEYIQATSRVGRRHPGLVVTIFNSARSRDRSHYENFIPYHQSLYRAVEATSATPFAARARDRGLHGILVALARLLFEEFSDNVGAQHAEAHQVRLRRVAEIIRARADACSEESAETAEQLDRLLEAWVEAAATRQGLSYYLKRNPEASLLVDASEQLLDADVSEFGDDRVPWPTLQSLRDVDAESSLYLLPVRRPR